MNISSCLKCALCKTRHNMVIGRGNYLPSDILFIGEAPGEGEDLTGKAFIGPSGKLLDKQIDCSMLNLKHTCFFTNTILCRPPENREPKKEEIIQCHDNIVNIINIVSPKYIVFVGSISAKVYLKEVKKADIPSSQIIHPSHILKEGGENSALYLHNIRLLEDVNTFLKRIEENEKDN